MAIDAVAMLFALLGGIFMGSYPVPLKCATVLKLQVQPIVFQCYKSFWIFVFACFVILFGGLGRGLVFFDFSWWGVLSAAFWVPGGLCTIGAVPKLGMAPTIVVGTSAGSVSSFLVFWLVLGEHMKHHGQPDAPYFLAPVYLGSVLAGMVTLVAAPLLPEWPCCGGSPALADSKTSQKIISTSIKTTGDYCKTPEDSGYCNYDAEHAPLVLECNRKDSIVSYGNTDLKPRDDKTWATGVMLALAAGLLSAIQAGIIQIGKRTAQHAAGCTHNFLDCPIAVREKFHVFGSWAGSFGCGALFISGIFFALITSIESINGRRPPDLNPKVMGGPGSLAGICWSFGFFFQTAALVRGGNAVMMPVNNAAQLVVSGLWGLLYYHEVRGTHRIVLWVLAAIWTLIMMVFLTKEKISD